ncbi:hypothetical protein RBB50_012104 [Rhinocladiella similis]
MVSVDVEVGILGDIAAEEVIRCVDMHTCGEPARIIYSGFPRMTGTTLLAKREQASKEYDHIRRRVILEPRGHWDMYGAVLVPETELVAAGQADMGVLFLHNAGFSKMCGHATLALGRFLVDAPESIFPRRKELRVDAKGSTTQFNIHAPTGILKLSVPTLPNGRSDPSRPVSFVSVPCYASGISVQIPIKFSFRWPELEDRKSVKADFSYGGVFYCLVDAQELGFPEGLAHVDIAKMKFAASLLKAAVNTNPELSPYTIPRDSSQPEPLYSVLIVDRARRPEKTERSNCHGFVAPNSEETGLCFFADGQIDRSPTGGGVAARIALAYATGELTLTEKRLYHSLLSKANSGSGAFTGSINEIVQPNSERSDPNSRDDTPAVKVLVEGRAFYTGTTNILVEKEDDIASSGFAFNQLESCRIGPPQEIAR